VCVCVCVFEKEKLVNVPLGKFSPIPKEHSIDYSTKRAALGRVIKLKWVLRKEDVGSFYLFHFRTVYLVICVFLSRIVRLKHFPSP
jgi:hypothetical protein